MLMEESRSVRSSKNIISGFALKTVLILLAFVSKTVFVKVFGVDMLGINGLFANVIAILCLADLGFSTAMTYCYYKPIAENNHEKIAQLNQFYRKVYNVIAVGITVIGITLMPFLKHIINLDHEIEHIYIYYLLTLATTVASYLMVYKSTVLYAYQQSYLITRYDLIISTIKTTVQIVLMIITRNYIVFLFASIVFALANNIVVSKVADKNYPFINEKVSPLDMHEKKGIFDNLGSVFLYKMSSVLMNSTDNIIISKIVGTVSVGYYSNYLTVVNLVSGYVSIAFTSLTASIGNVMAKDSKEKQFNIFKDVQMISMWMTVVLPPCLYVLIDSFISIWLGKSFVLDGMTTIAVSINFFLLCILNPIWMFREAAGIYQKTKYVMLVCALLNIVLSIALGMLMGLSGVLFASAISRLLTYVWYEPIILFRDFFQKSAKDFFTSSIGITLLSAAVTGLLYFINSLISLNGVFGFIVSGLACFVAANAVFVGCFFRNKHFREVLIRGFELLKMFKGKTA